MKEIAGPSTMTAGDDGADAGADARPFEEVCAGVADEPCCLDLKFAIHVRASCTLGRTPPALEGAVRGDDCLDLNLEIQFRASSTFGRARVLTLVTRDCAMLDLCCRASMMAGKRVVSWSKK